MTAHHVVEVDPVDDGPVTVEVRQAGRVIGSITVPAAGTAVETQEHESQTIDERGRELIEIADTVTEMRQVKHAFEAGIRAMKGIDY